MGCATWPDEDEYETCPECGSETGRFSNAGRDLLGPEEARSRKLIAEFEVAYEKHCDDRGYAVDGPLPAWRVREIERARQDET